MNVWSSLGNILPQAPRISRLVITSLDANFGNIGFRLFCGSSIKIFIQGSQFGCPTCSNFNYTDKHCLKLGTLSWLSISPFSSWCAKLALAPADVA